MRNADLVLPVGGEEVFLGFRNEIYLFPFDHILYLFLDALFNFWVSFLKTGVPFVVLKIQIFSQFPKS